MSHNGKPTFFLFMEGGDLAAMQNAAFQAWP
jgi:hypothetical protein